ncbi:hypothetical protein EHS25_009443 [Saitozyma podzolica]|uniref:RING-type domain-containing protein n=1 Tax=Saitozyma podzolica TaxID=1890683 RepID=A0A427YJ67_9TREE|nr:hypothetical protein EHS25_009443 [Saitozyma podzolica]
MPRRNRASSSSSSSQGPLSEFKAAIGLDDRPTGMNGYEVESVCLHCLSLLQVTAAPLEILRSLPLKRLKEYLAAYNIPCIGPKEKEDFVQAVIKARNPATGCLSPEAESYYRRRSVPKNGQPPAQPGNSRPRPPPQAQAHAHAHAQARPPPSAYARPPPPQRPPQTQPPPRPQSQPNFRPAAPRPTPPRAPPATPPPPRQPTPPVPTIMSLVSLPRSYLSSLSIGTLKAILYENHVRVDFKQVLEKEELVNRVFELVTDERKRLERQRHEEERLANGNGARTPSPRVEGDKSEGSGESTPGEEAANKVPTGPMPEVERGLCVVCQDEEATLAVVDCGHLCMCAHCSDLIMATSQECPLCRTRIVTKQRLIRIYQV